jgi:hypothetical protein
LERRTTRYRRFFCNEKLIAFHNGPSEMIRVALLNLTAYPIHPVQRGLDMTTILAAIQGGGIPDGLVLLLCFLSLGSLYLWFWIWAIVDCIRNPVLSKGERVAWFFGIVCTHWLGIIAYLIFGQQPRLRRMIKMRERHQMLMGGRDPA